MSIRAKWLNKVKWDEHGLVPVIVQEVGSNDVLMFAWMNRDALSKTVEMGEEVPSAPASVGPGRPSPSPILR